jgi:hypothetical protein
MVYMKGHFESYKCKRKILIIPILEVDAQKG